MSDEGNAVSVFFEQPAHRAGCSKRPSYKATRSEERRRAVEHVAVTSDEGNDVDGAFSAAC